MTEEFVCPASEESFCQGKLADCQINSEIYIIIIIIDRNFISYSLALNLATWKFWLSCIDSYLWPIKIGAEARLYLTTVNGNEVICKERFSKKYRVVELDKHIRHTNVRNEVRKVAYWSAVYVLPLIFHLSQIKSTKEMRSKEHPSSASSLFRYWQLLRLHE